MKIVENIEIQGQQDPTLSRRTSHQFVIAKPIGNICKNFLKTNYYANFYKSSTWKIYKGTFATKTLPKKLKQGRTLHEKLLERSVNLSPDLLTTSSCLALR